MAAATVLTSDSMRKVVEEEGLEARNLVNWNVIVSEKGSIEVPKTSKKPPLSPRPQSSSSVSPLPPKDIDTRLSKRCSSLRHPKSRIRSSSVGRNPEKSLRARYWAFLFENLYRAVDEIYQTCEMDESIVESKEAIMMLENYCKEFQALIQWLNISKNYEVTSPPNRPTSLAWEVRKSLPSKGVLKNAFLDKIGSSGNYSKKKSDSLGDLLLKTTVIQSDAGKNAPENRVVTAVKCVDTASNDKNIDHNFISNQNPKVCLSTVSADENNSNSDDNISNLTVSVIHSETEMALNIITSDVHSPASNTSASDCINKTDTDVVDLIEESTDNTPVEVAIADDLNAKSSIPFSVSEEKEIKLPLTTEIVNSNVEAPLENKVSEDIIKEQKNNILKNNETESSCEDSVERSVGNHDEIDKTSAKSVETINMSCDLDPEAKNPAVLFLDVQPVGSTVRCKTVLNIHEDETIKSCTRGTSPMVSDSNFSNSSSVDISISSDQARTITSDVGVQTIPIDNKNSSSSIPLSKGATSPRTKVQADTKNAVAIKKAVTPIQTSRLQNKAPQTTLHSQTAVQNGTSTIVHQNKDALKKMAPAPFRFSKSAVTPNSVVKGINAVTAVKPLSQRKIVTNGPMQELKPFRAGVYEPKLRCASHVPTPPISYRKFGVKKSSDTAPSHMSRPSQHYIGKDATKPDPKSASTSSLSSTSSVKSWVCKAKEKNPDLNGNIKHGGSSDNPDDADGWETVRGRTRCKNSPAKKLVVNQNAIDTAMAAKLNQSKMGGFMYNSTSSSQTTKPGNSVSKTKLSKEDSDDETTQEFASLKKSKISVKPSTTISLLKRKADIENKEKTADGKTEVSKSKKKISTNSKLFESNSGNDTVNKGGKNIFKNSDLKRQLSTDNIKREKATIQTPAVLKKSHSSCSIDLKKKESKQLCQKTTESSKTSQDSEATCPTKTLIKAKGVSSENCSSQEINGIKSTSGNVNEKNDTCSASSSLSHKQVDFNLLSSKGDEISSNQSSDLDEVLTSDDLEGMTSHDEGLTDAQELEMYEKMIAEEAQEHISALGLSWGDQMDLLDIELRTPGRALQMHEKLSSPFRKRPLSETIRLHEEKQLKAQEQRERLLEEKAQRSKDIQKKVEEMKALNEKKAEQQRVILEQKLQRAEEKRKKQIEMIVRKAHDEEEKVNEIAFINSLEAQNKRHDLISKEKDHEARLHDIQEERQRKLDEKAAKEAAAEERRKLLEAERQARLLEMQEKRKQRDLKIEQQLMEKEKERQELANQKARNRELRKSALNAAQQATVEELQKKIQLKQEESARRHEVNMEQIRQKAFELSVRRYSSNNDDAPQLVPYETKKICTICNVLIGSEVYLLSHLRGKKHQAMITDWHQGHDPSTEELELYNLKHIVNASMDQLDPNIALDKERQKALKKRCKKLRQKLEKRASEFEKYLPNSPPLISPKMQKIINELKKIYEIQENSIWDNVTVDSLEKVVKEIMFSFNKFPSQDKLAFRALGGLNILVELKHKLIVPSTSDYTLTENKMVTQLFDVVELILREDHEYFGYLLFNNKVGQALDVLSQRLNLLIPDNFSQLCNGSTISNGHSSIDEIAGELMLFISFILNHLSKRDLTVPALERILPNESAQNLNQRLEIQIADIVSYTVSIGIVDRLSQLFNSIRGPTDFNPKVALFVQKSLAFLTAVMKLFCDREEIDMLHILICEASANLIYESTLDRKKIDDTTQFMATLKVTDLVGVVSLLYCILLHDGSASVQETPPPQLPKHITVSAVAVLRLLNQVAVLNLHLIQSSLGSEGLSLQLRHIASYLLWYCSHWDNALLLHELILLLGYFTVSNADNQVLIQAGQCPTVLQQLCALPFSYFSTPKLAEILFPTLLACSYNNECNKAVLRQEMAIELLSTYLESKLLDGYTVMQTTNAPTVRWCLHTRFPKYQWSPAKLYFLN